MMQNVRCNEKIGYDVTGASLQASAIYVCLVSNVLHWYRKSMLINGPFRTRPGKFVLIQFAKYCVS